MVSRMGRQPEDGSGGSEQRTQSARAALPLLANRRCAILRMRAALISVRVGRTVIQFRGAPGTHVSYAAPSVRRTGLDPSALSTRDRRVGLQPCLPELDSA